MSSAIGPDRSPSTPPSPRVAGTVPPGPVAVRFVRNVAWNFGGQAWSLGLAFFTTPYIVHRLGTDAYGLLMTAGIVTSYLWFADLGLGSATTKYVAEHAAREEWDEVNRIVWTSLAAYLVLGSLAAVALVAVTPLCVYRWFRIPAQLQGAALGVFHLSALGLLLGMVNNAPASIPRALQRFDVVNRIGVAVGTAQTLVAVALLALGYSVREVVAGNLVVAGLSLGVNAWVARRLLPRRSLPVWDPSSFRRLLRFGGFVTVSGIVGPILVQFEKLVLANQRSTAALAYYAVPYSLTTKLWAVSGAFSSALFPLFSSLQGIGRDDMNAAVALRVSRHIVLFLTPAVVVLVVFGREFLRFWMGPDFATRSAAALQILAVATLVNAAAWSPYTLLQASGRPDLTARFHLIELAIHLPVTLVCVHLWAITGAALAWFLRCALDTALIYWGAAKLGTEDWRRWVRELLSPPVGVAVASGAILATWRTIAQGRSSPSPGVLMGLGGVSLAAVALSMWRWGLRREEFHVLAHALWGRRE